MPRKFHSREAPRMPSLRPRGGIGQKGLPIFVKPFRIVPVRPDDPKFARPAPPTRDFGIGRAQLRKFEQQLRREALGIPRRSRRT